MNSIFGHLTRCLVAGFVALLPVGGFVLSVGYAEYMIAEWWLQEQDFYFPGLGLLGVGLILYLVGLVVSTFLGRWLWKRVDALLNRLPTLGQLYQTLKQVLGYGEGKDAMFREVVLVPGREPDTEELGLVTGDAPRGPEQRLLVFIPGAPNPAAGRLILVEPGRVRKTDLAVSDALKTLVSLGKTEISLE